MIDHDKETRFIAQLLSNKELYSFIINSLQQSLSSIGFSKELISYLTINLRTLDNNKFYEIFQNETYKIYLEGFFQDIVPRYFEKNVLPELPDVHKILDIGCGNGILLHRLSKCSNIKEFVGIDINPYSEWKKFQRGNLRYLVVKEDEFTNFMKKEQPDTFSLTWVLHHMEFKEQERYLEYLYNLIAEETKIVVLEDSYSESMPPEEGEKKHEAFMSLSKESKQKAMSVYDWIANRVLAHRMKEPIPFTYRTLEQWKELFTSKGFKVIKKRFIGFPAERDINTPQSLLVLKK